MANNKDVPIEVVLKNTLIENGKLKSEIQHLEAELQNKNNAIKAFKEWQKKCINYNLQQMFDEAMKTLDDDMKEKFKIMKSIKDNHSCFLKRYRQLDNLINQMMRKYQFACEKEKILREIMEKEEEVEA